MGDRIVFGNDLLQVIAREPRLNVCGQADQVKPALEAIDQLRPDVMLVNLPLSGKRILEVIKELRIVNPPGKLLVMSTSANALDADRVLRAGGDGYILSQESPTEIVHAVRDVLNGHIYVSEAVLARGTETEARDGGRSKVRRPRRRSQP